MIVYLLDGCVQQAYFTFKSIQKAGHDISFLTIDNDCKMFPLINEKVINICTDMSALKNYDIVIFSSLIVHQHEVLNVLKY